MNWASLFLMPIWNVRKRDDIAAIMQKKKDEQIAKIEELSQTGSLITYAFSCRSSSPWGSRCLLARVLARTRQLQRRGTYESRALTCWNEEDQSPIVKRITYLYLAENSLALTFTVFGCGIWSSLSAMAVFEWIVKKDYTIGPIGSFLNSTENPLWKLFQHQKISYQF